MLIFDSIVSSRISMTGRQTGLAVKLAPASIFRYACKCELFVFWFFFSTLNRRVLKIHIPFIKSGIFVHISEGEYKQKQAIQTVSHEYEWR